MAEEKGPQWAMATPAVIYMVGVACLGIFGMLMGWFNPGAIPIMGIFLMMCGLVTLPLGVISLRRGDILLGSINMVFGALIFLGLGSILAYVGWTFANLGGAPAILQADLRIAGFFAAGISLLFFCFLPSVGKVSWFLFLAFIVLGVGLAFLAAGLINGTAFGDFPMSASGICFLIWAIMVIYLGTAFITNTVYQAPKLSIGGPIIK
jgi:hypothetical protein